MKKIFLLVSALSLTAASVASAAPAASSPSAAPASSAPSADAAKVLSVKAAALQPRRAPVKGEAFDGGLSTGVIVAIVAGVAGGLALALSGGGDSR
jgi:hypothetical protein